MIWTCQVVFLAPFRTSWEFSHTWSTSHLRRLSGGIEDGTTKALSGMMCLAQKWTFFDVAMFLLIWIKVEGDMLSFIWEYKMIRILYIYYMYTRYFKASLYFFEDDIRAQKRSLCDLSVLCKKLRWIVILLLLVAPPWYLLIAPLVQQPNLWCPGWGLKLTTTFRCPKRFPFSGVDSEGWAHVGCRML